MSAPSNTNDALDKINRDECIVFDHWKQINDQLRLLRFELSSIPIDDPRRVEISKLIENLKLMKKKYNDTLQIPSYSLVTKSATVIQHSPPMPSETSQHCNSLDSTLHQPLCSNYDENTILTDLMNIDNQTILCQLDHYVKELSSNWKGKILFPCHVVFDCASITNSTSITDPPPMVDICDYVGGQMYNVKRLYFSPTVYLPPTSASDMLSTNAHLCMGWVKLCRELMVAAHECGNPIVCNGSQKSNVNNRVFRCGMLYPLT